MPYRVCKRLDVESGHMLSKHDGACRFPHGHSRQVEIVLEADALDAQDMVCDFGVIKAAVETFLATFDHTLCVNTDDPQFGALRDLYGDRVIAFDRTDPTTEVIARRIYDTVVQHLAAYRQSSEAAFPVNAEVVVRRVRVWETGTAWAEYEAP